MYVKNAPNWLNVRSGAGTNYSKVGKLYNGDKVTVYETKGNWSRIGDGKWVSSNYLSSSSPSKPSNPIKNTVGQIKVLKQNCYLYANSNLTGTKYPYLKNTRVKILKNISSSVDYIQVIKTGRKAYVQNKYLK